MKAKSCCCFRLETGTWMIAVASIIILALVEYFKKSEFIENLYFDVIYTIFSTVYLTYSSSGVFLRISLFITPMLLLYSVVYKKPHYAFPWLCFKFTALMIYFWLPLMVYADLLVSADEEIKHDAIFHGKYNNTMLNSIICYVISSSAQFYIFSVVHNWYNNSRSLPSQITTTTTNENLQLGSY